MWQVLETFSRAHSAAGAGKLLLPVIMRPGPGDDAPAGRHLDLRHQCHKCARSAIITMFLPKVWSGLCDPSSDAPEAVPCEGCVVCCLPAVGTLPACQGSHGRHLGFAACLTSPSSYRLSACAAGTSLKGFFTRDGVVIVNNSGRLVRTTTYNTCRVVIMLLLAIVLLLSLSSLTSAALGSAIKARRLLLANASGTLQIVLRIMDLLCAVSPMSEYPF